MGTTFAWYDRFVNERRDLITKTWFSTMVEKYDAFYKHDFLLEGGFVYYDVLMNLHEPVSPEHNMIRSMVQQSMSKRLPVDHIMLSHMIWRDTLVSQFWDFVLQNGVEMREAASTVRMLHQRIDTIQTHICLVSWDQASRRLDSQEEHIDQLHQDRLNMIGKMAAGMAHEIRNPLTAIGGFLRMIRSQLSDDSLQRVSKYLDIIDREMKVLFGQITGFLSFSRNNGMEESYVKCTVEELALSVQELTEPRLNNEGIECELELNAEAPITIQKTAIQQVLINLINNSADALQDVDYPGKIRIVSRQDDKYVYIDVEDNGPGIPGSIAHQVFSAFATTKRNGTGIGLAICKQIIEKNAGAISYTSQAGKTVFTIALQKEKDDNG